MFDKLVAAVLLHGVLWFSSLCFICASLDWFEINKAKVDNGMWTWVSAYSFFYAVCVVTYYTHLFYIWR